MASFVAGSDPSDPAVHSQNSRKKMRLNAGASSYLSPLPLFPPPAVSRDEGSPNEAKKKKEKREIDQVDEQDDDIDDTDPFGLEGRAKVWLKEELDKKQTSNGGYVPYKASNGDGTVPAEHWDSAYAEFYKRFVEDTSSTGPSVLLVATNVKEDWAPGEEQLKAKYLFFPRIEYDGESLSALFITYMPGKEHGAADAYVSHTIGAWRFGNKLLKRSINSGLSSGDYGKGNPQPDQRVFPWNRDHNCANNDSDKRNGNVPFSRLVWEVEWQNRNPLDIRLNGHRLMKSPYNRLYLAAKLYGVDDDGFMEAAIVLWGRNEHNDDRMEMIEAISFGTKDLTQDHKEEFATERRDCLVGVPADKWKRPDLPVGYPDTDEACPELMMKIPLDGVLYKVSCKVPGRQEPRYLTELLANAAVTVPALEINLCELLASVLNVIEHSRTQT